MAYLGLATKKSESSIPDASQKGSSVLQNATSDEAKKLAAAALSAVKDAAAAASGRGKVEVHTNFFFHRPSLLDLVG